MFKIINEKQALGMARNPQGQVSGLIAVHNGVFHADDVFFVAALTIVTSGMTVVRTRNQEVLKVAEIVGDVGGVFNPEAGRFDHHQKGGAGVRASGVPYAAFGLLWNLKPGFKLETSWDGFEPDDARQGAVGGAVDRSLVQAIDAADCGFTCKETADPTCWGEGWWEKETTPRYSLSAAISSFNPTWREAGQDFDAAFTEAVGFAQAILRRELVSADAEVEAVDQVRKVMGSAEADGTILVLSRFLPWQETVIKEAPLVQFVVFPSETGDWRIQAVPASLGSFQTRKALPESWAGLRGAELAAAVRAMGGEMEDSEAVFCHPGRFICGATSFDAAMQMARIAAGKL